MPKNIVLCSDGTGNSGSKAVGTNVWRVFEAVDLGAPPDGGVRQEVFYDDGVGTEDLKLIKAVSGATGRGLRRNVRDLYAYLIKRYEPGDRIYLFGFSRGAFTVRVFANLLLYCGIPSRFTEPGSRLERTESEIAAIAKKGVDLYARRKFHQPDAESFTQFRQEYGWRGTKEFHNVADEPGWFPLHFIGVWDTVDAYGMPFDELSRSMNRLLPLRLRDDNGLRENDLHPLIDHAYHALALDDERHSFHPKLWLEADPVNPQVASSNAGTTSAEPSHRGRNFEFSEKLTKANRKPPKAEQVWFAGMHSNVGGGYDQDHLAYVSLIWMIIQARRDGLRFDPAKLAEYRQGANPNGKMHDSRSGLACYFRYRPRDIEQLSADAGIKKPKLHDTVLERIQHRTFDYAPTGVPESYELVPGNVQPQETAASAKSRKEQQLIVDDLIWHGRVHYVLFVAATIALVVTSWMISDNQPDAERWGYCLRFVRDALKPLLGLATWITPSYFKPGIQAFSERPDCVLGFGTLFAALVWKSRYLVARTRRESNLAWQIGLGTTSAIATAKKRSGIASWLRDSACVNAAARLFYKIAPVLILVAIALGMLALAWRWLGPATDANGVPRETGNQFAMKAVKSAAGHLDTARRMNPMPVFVTEGERYRVRVEPMPKERWFDASLPASPNGLLRDKMTDEQIEVTEKLKYFEPLRRVADQDWFYVMASVGPDGDELHPIGESGSFRAKSTGRLYVFVNDARGFYHNNSGAAYVIIERLDD